MRRVTEAFKQAFGYGDSSSKNKKDEEIARYADETSIIHEEEDEDLRYLYGEGYNDVLKGEISACLEVNEQTNPVKLASLEIEQVEESLAKLVGRIQLLPNSDDPHESGVIEEELNRLLFRLDDVETRGDANLKEIRTQSLRQVKGALQSLSVKAVVEKSGLSGNHISSDDVSVTKVSQVDSNAINEGGEKTNAITTPDNNNGDQITPSCSSQIDNSNRNEDKTDKNSVLVNNNPVDADISHTPITPITISPQIYTSNKNEKISKSSTLDNINSIDFDRHTPIIPTISTRQINNFNNKNEEKMDETSALDNINPVVTDSDTPIAPTSSPQIDISDKNKEITTFLNNKTIIPVDSVGINHAPIVSTSAVPQIDLSATIKEEKIVNSNSELVKEKSVETVKQINLLSSLDLKQTDSDVQVPSQENKTKPSVNSTEVEEKSSASDLTTIKNGTVNLKGDIIADEEPSTLHDTVQQYEVLTVSPVEISNETHSSDNFVLPSGDSNVTQQETRGVIDSCSDVDMTEETISIEDMDTTPSADDFDLQQRPVQLLDQDSEGRFTLNEHALMQILGHESVKNRKLAIISVVGAFRRGKSFLLNFILRYLQADGAPNWLEGENKNLCNELNGFSWQGGMDRDTTGILMWSKPFLIGDDLAVVLVDTQGTFDSKTSMKQSSFIFTLSTLMSSVQIFNISERIQMDDLTNLQHFLEFGRMVNNSCDSKVFEKFIFLIRDWKFPQKMSFGFHGGNMLLNEWFKNQASSEQSQMIETCFDKVECFLMPHPGEKVSCDDCFRGDLNDIHLEFLTQLKTFVESIIEDICIKRIGESFLMAGELSTYLVTFIERLQDPNLEPKTLMTALSDIMFEKARKEAEFFYTQEMESQLRVCGNLAELHDTTLNKALQIYDKVYPFGGTEVANAKRNTVKEVLIEKSKHLFQRVVRDEVSAAFNQYQTHITTFCNGVGFDISITLVDEHEKACKAACETLFSRLTPLIDEKQLNDELALLKKRAQKLCVTMEPMYALRFKKELAAQAEKEANWKKQQDLHDQVQATQLQLQAMQIRSELSEALNTIPKQYLQAMQKHCSNSRFTSDMFLTIHKKERFRALASFEVLIQKFSMYECKNYIDLAKKEIDYHYEQLQKQENMKHKNLLTEAYNSAIKKYQDRMSDLKLDEKPVPNLKAHHVVAFREAVAILYHLKDCSMFASFHSKLTKEIEGRYKLFEKMNEKTKQLLEDKELYMLDIEMKHATQFYQSEMMKHCNTENSHLELSNHHAAIKDKCIHQFKQAVTDCKNQDKIANILDELQKEIEFLYHGYEESEGRKQILLREKEHKRTGKKNCPIGIDLGTTNCCVAVYENKKVKIMKNNIGKTTTPSSVYFGKDGHTFGDSAILRGCSDPPNCISEMKRIIGRKFNDSVVQDLKKRWCFEVTESNGNPVVNVTEGNKRQLLPEEISGLVLEEMKRLASVYLDSEVFDAVVTIPAYFNETQREATKRACNLAGINVLRIINEPTAAAIAYGLQTNAEILRTVLVFDFGGGTCDVSILEMERGRYTVKASQGDNQLGGEDFDDNLTDYMAKLYKKKTKITLKNTDLRRLRHQCEKAKRQLTDCTECEVRVEMDESSAVDLKEKITRNKFEEINKDLYPRILVPLKDCLESAGMKVKDIDEVVLAGGSSRMTKVQNMLKQFFPCKDIKIRINPDEAIAYGAAIQAALSSGLYEGDLHVTDITPMSLGISCIDGENQNAYSIIVPRNSELPTKCVEQYYTDDYNSAVSINVYQGEHTESKFKNSKIGAFTMDTLDSSKKRTDLDVTFVIDEDGILDVTACESSNHGNSKSIRITKCVK